MVEPGEGAELLLSLVRAMAPALRPCSAPPRQSGSANRANKADIGLLAHRDPNRDPTRTDIFVRKVRFKQVGKIGTTSLRYDQATGRQSGSSGGCRSDVCSGHFWLSGSLETSSLDSKPRCSIDAFQNGKLTANSTAQ